MAAANESQGLKIAVAAFVTLTVILAVTSYFLYSAYSQAEAQLESEQDKLTQGQKAASDALNQYDEFRRSSPALRAEEYDAAKAEVATYFKKIDERIGNLANTVNAAIEQGPGGWARRAGARGRQGQGPDDRQLVSQRAEQDLHLVRSTGYRAAGERRAARAPSCRSTTSA